MERMCNLYPLNKKRDDVARFFRVSHNRAAAYEPLSAIFPCHTAPIIKQSADGERELVMRSWGFILLRDGYAPKRVTNPRRQGEPSFGRTALSSGDAWYRRRPSASPTRVSQHGGTGSRSTARRNARCSRMP